MTKVKKETMITLELNTTEAEFLFNLLDQVNVRGIQQKAAVLSLMARITDRSQKKDK